MRSVGWAWKIEFSGVAAGSRRSPGQAYVTAHPLHFYPSGPLAPAAVPTHPNFNLTTRPIHHESSARQSLFIQAQSSLELGSSTHTVYRRTGRSHDGLALLIHAQAAHASMEQGSWSPWGLKKLPYVAPLVTTIIPSLHTVNFSTWAGLTNNKDEACRDNLPLLRSRP